MISTKEVEDIHKTLIHLFGGSDGIRDLSDLESSLSLNFEKLWLVDFFPNKNLS